MRTVAVDEAAMLSGSGACRARAARLERVVGPLGLVNEYRFVPPGKGKEEKIKRFFL